MKALVVNRFVISFFILFSNSSLTGQPVITLNSNDNAVHLSVWSAGDNPAANGLLVPGSGGEALSGKRTDVVTLCPTGWYDGRGTCTFVKAFEDDRNTTSWIGYTDRPDINSSNVIIGGHSWKWRMSVAYAAQNNSVFWIFSDAVTGQWFIIRKDTDDEKYVKMPDQSLSDTQAPEGPIKCSIQDGLQELADRQDKYGILENNALKADRSILIICGREDGRATIDAFLQSNYRAFRKVYAENTTFLSIMRTTAFGASGKSCMRTSPNGLKIEFNWIC